MEEIKKNYLKITVDDIGFLYLADSKEQVVGRPVGGVKLALINAPHTIDDVIDTVYPPKLANAFDVKVLKEVLNVKGCFYHAYAIQFYHLSELPSKSSGDEGRFID